MRRVSRHPSGSDARIICPPMSGHLLLMPSIHPAPSAFHALLHQQHSVISELLVRNDAKCAQAGLPPCWWLRSAERFGGGMAINDAGAGMFVRQLAFARVAVQASYQSARREADPRRIIWRGSRCPRSGGAAQETRALSSIIFVFAQCGDTPPRASAGRCCCPRNQGK